MEEETFGVPHSTILVDICQLIHFEVKGKRGYFQGFHKAKEGMLTTYKGERAHFKVTQFQARVNDPREQCRLVL